MNGVHEMCKFAKLTESQIEEIRKFEVRWKNLVLLAYEKPSEPAHLSSEQVKQIQRLEKELNVTLVAYR